jgi:hypothetical protein
VATQSDAQTVDYLCRKHDIERIYDLGAGTLEFAVEMDKRGYDTVAYETLQGLTKFALNRLPENNVEVRTQDYYADWELIKDDHAAFVALGKLNRVPSETAGLIVDGMSSGSATYIAESSQSG